MTTNKKSSKWFNSMSAMKFYGGLVGAVVFSIHAIVGYINKSFAEMTDFNLTSGSPLISTLLAIIALVLAVTTYKNQRW